MIITNSTVVCALGDDSYETCMENGWRTYTQLNEIQKHTLKLRDGTEVVLHLCEGGDNKYLNGCSGQCGCNAMEGCCYCTARTSDFHLTWEALRATNTRVFERTLKWQVQASHTELDGVISFPYVCPCCNKNITQVEGHGPTGSDASMRKWQQQHASQRFNCPPLPHIDPSRCIPDMLHINLRIVAQLYWHTTQRHCGSSTEMIAKLQQWMLDNLKIKVILIIRHKRKK